MDNRSGSGSTGLDRISEELAHLRRELAQGRERDVPTETAKMRHELEAIQEQLKELGGRLEDPLNRLRDGPPAESDTSENR